MHTPQSAVDAIEVVRLNRQQRRMRGKSDPLDAINALRAVLSEGATTRPKDRTGRAIRDDLQHRPASLDAA